MKSSDSVRSIAVLEIIKGIAVLLAGIGTVFYIDNNVKHHVRAIMHYLHLKPSRFFPENIIGAIRNPTKETLILLASCTFLYAAMRFIEAYGLWKLRNWAKWFGLCSAALYIPFEIYKIATKPCWMSLLPLIINMVIILILYDSIKNHNANDKIDEHAKSQIATTTGKVQNFVELDR